MDITVRMDDGLLYPAIVGLSQGTVTVYSDSEADAMMLGIFELRGNELYSGYLMTEREEHVGTIVDE